MKLIYRPFGIAIGLLAGILGKKIFDFAWTKIDDEDPPKATTEHAVWPKVIAAAALQGVIFKTVRVVVDRFAARGYASLTGVWPGEHYADPEKD